MSLWIESHTRTIRLRKCREMAGELRLRPVYLLGHLHVLWHAALEQQEDGDLSSWSDEFIADQAEYPGDAPQFVRLLQKYRWLDGKTIHDWLDYAGRYLIRKYASSHRDKLVAIWQKHGRAYGSDRLVTGKKPDSDLNATPPNQPTNQPAPKPPKTERRKPGKPPDDTGPPSALVQAILDVAPIPPELDTPQVRASWADYVAHRQRMPEGKRITEFAARKLLKQLIPFGAETASRKLDCAVANGWRGAVFPNDKPPAGNGQARKPIDKVRKFDD